MDDVCYDEDKLNLAGVLWEKQTCAGARGQSLDEAHPKNGGLEPQKKSDVINMGTNSWMEVSDTTNDW